MAKMMMPEDESPSEEKMDKSETSLDALVEQLPENDQKLITKLVQRFCENC